jgi:hypothetical protein
LLSAIEAQKLRRVYSDKPTADDMDYALQIHYREEWLLTPLVRARLYSRLNYPQDGSLRTWGTTHFELLLDSRIAMIRNIQEFALQMAYSKHINHDPQAILPNLQYFIDDIFFLLHILEMYVPTKEVWTRQELFAVHPLPLFQNTRGMSWVERWRSCQPNPQDVWFEYTSALCDLLYGLPNNGPEGFSNTPLPYNKAANLLSSVSLNGRKPQDTPPTDHRLFDASFIERCGPFRFKATDSIEKHLLITEDKEILFYCEWKRWAYLTYHRLLSGRTYFIRSDVLLSSDRYVFYLNNIRLALSYTYFDLVSVNILCFYQHMAVKESSRHPYTIWGNLQQAVLSRLRLRYSSLDIARRLKINIPEAEMRAHIAPYIEQGGGSLSSFVDRHSVMRNCYPFKERVDKLQQTLKDWRPETIWQLRYSGYGGVDPVGLYAFYFAAIFGLLTIMGLAATGAQTFAAFKALPPSG